MMDAIESRTVSIEDAGTILGVSRPTAYKLAKTDSFPVLIIRVGDSIRVSKAALDSLLHMTKPQQVAACCDEVAAVQAELSRATAQRDRLRAWGEHWHGCADAYYYERDDVPHLEPGDLPDPEPAQP